MSQSCNGIRSIYNVKSLGYTLIRPKIGIPLNEDAVAVIRQNIGNHDTHVFTRNGKTIKKARATAWKKALKDALQLLSGCALSDV